MQISVIRPIPQAAVDFVKAHEGCRLTVYADVGGVLTVGYGHTSPALRPGQTIQPSDADAFLAQDLTTAATRLEGAVGEPCVNELTSNQYSALLSFVLNVGIDPKWRICQLLRAQQFDQIPAELMRFVNAGGKKVQGLVNRRADEVKLWSTDEPGSIPTSPSSSVTRAVDTPPTDSASSLTPTHKQPGFVAGCVAACTGAAAQWAPQIKSGADGVSSAIAPYVGKSEVLAAISSHLALVAACAAASVPVLLWVKNREAKSS